jgi:hypothetical protein
VDGPDVRDLYGARVLEPHVWLRLRGRVCRSETVLFRNRPSAHAGAVPLFHQGSRSDPTGARGNASTTRKEKRMQNYALMLTSTLLMLAGALVFAHFGLWWTGVALFLLAVTPLPTMLAERVSTRLARARSAP